jgi:cytochrome c oxidase subunit IV
MTNESLHVSSFDLHGKILISLMVLLSVSVLAAWLDLKQWTIVIAMTVSCIKAYLVLTYFMHLKFEKLVFRLMVGMVFGLLVVIFVLLFFDYWFR